MRRGRLSTGLGGSGRLIQWVRSCWFGGSRGFVLGSFLRRNRVFDSAMADFWVRFVNFFSTGQTRFGLSLESAGAGVVRDRFCTD